MAESIKAGTKRPHSTLEEHSQKRRKVHHRLRHVQNVPRDIEPATQDPVFAQGQLLRSLTAALTVVGFDSVKPTALEMFRAMTEEYMLHFLHHVRTSMQSSRRTKPTPQDFISALSHTPNTARASLLKSQLSSNLPSDISTPTISPPDAAPPSAPDFSALLSPLMVKDTPRYIPGHFPGLPPRHSWQSTPVFAEREVDARKMREKAMEEGLLAETALRKLAAAAKAGAAKAERRRVDAAIAGQGRSRAIGAAAVNGKKKGKRHAVQTAARSEEMFADALKEVGGDADDGDEAMELGLGLDGQRDLRGAGVDLDMPDGVVVNYGMGGWRHSGRRHLRL